MSKNEQFQAIIKKLIIPIIDTRDIAVHAKVGKGEVRQVKEDSVGDSRLWHLWPYALGASSSWVRSDYMLVWLRGRGLSWLRTMFLVTQRPGQFHCRLLLQGFEHLQNHQMESGNALRSLWFQALSTKSLSKNRSFFARSDVSKKNLNITSVSDLGRDWAFTWTCGRRLVPKISTLNSSLLRNAWRLQFCLGGFNHDQPISNAWICGSSYFSSRFKDPWLFKYVQILFRQRVCANCQTVCDEAGSHLRRSETGLSMRRRNKTSISFNMWNLCISVQSDVVIICNHAVSRCIRQISTTASDHGDHRACWPCSDDLGHPLPGGFRSLPHKKWRQRLGHDLRWSSNMFMFKHGWSLPPEPAAQACPHWHIEVLMNVDASSSLQSTAYSQRWHLPHFDSILPPSIMNWGKSGLGYSHLILLPHRAESHADRDGSHDHRWYRWYK